MTNIWKVVSFECLSACDLTNQELAEMLEDNGDAFFSTEAKALAYAASLRDGEDNRNGEPLLVWQEEHDAPNFRWFADNAENGVVVRVARVTLDKE